MVFIIKSPIGPKKSPKIPKSFIPIYMDISIKNGSICVWAPRSFVSIYSLTSNVRIYAVNIIEALRYWWVNIKYIPKGNNTILLPSTGRASINAVKKPIIR